jgi:hypothetical protein
VETILISDDGITQNTSTEKNSTIIIGTKQEHYWKEALKLNAPLFIHASIYIELLKENSTILTSLQNHPASLILPLDQDASFQKFSETLLKRKWYKSGVLRIKRNNRLIDSFTSCLISDLYCLQKIIPPISRISGVCISHKPSNTQHTIITLRFSNNSIGHYEVLSSPSMKDGLDLEWSCRQGILEYQSEKANPLSGKVRKWEDDQRLTIQKHVKITDRLNEELRRLISLAEENVKQAVRG